MVEADGQRGGDALALKTEHERQNCANGKRIFLSMRKPELDTEVDVKTGSDISLDRKEERCNTDDVTKERHPHPDVLRERPLSGSHPQILSGLRGEGILGNKRVLPEFFGSPSKRLRTEVPSTNNENTFNFNWNMHSEESSVSKTSEPYLPAAGIIESEREQTPTSGDKIKKLSDVPHMAFDI